MTEHNPSPALEPDREARPKTNGKPNRILVVDDDHDIRRLNAALLERSGYAVDAAADGAAGWAALTAERYDLLITDNEMPHVTGVELLQKLHEARMALPVIMASGNLPVREFALHPWLKPHATFLKPYDLTEFLGTVKALLQAAEDNTSPMPVPLDWHCRVPANRNRL